MLVHNILHVLRQLILLLEARARRDRQHETIPDREAHFRRIVRRRSYRLRLGLRHPAGATRHYVAVRASPSHCTVVPTAWAEEEEEEAEAEAGQTPPQVDCTYGRASSDQPDTVRRPTSIHKSTILYLINAKHTQ
eukprot:COSAG02_NODE_6877_length_3312_cov_20.078743_2_plen_135_part_00